jgi:uncharacterized membrane protein YqjE
MIQTRVEAAGLVVQMQRTAVTQGLLLFGIAAVTALSFMTAVIVWIAVAAPPSWRGWALGILALALLATAIYCVRAASQRFKRDAGLIADYSRGLKLDLAMINLALKDPETEDEDKLAERELAKEKVREAAAEKAATPSTAEGGGAPSPEGAAREAADAAIRAAPPRADVSPAGPAGAEADAKDAGARTSGAGAAAYSMTSGGPYAATKIPDATLRHEDLNDTAQPDDTGRRQHHGTR